MTLIPFDNVIIGAFIFFGIVSIWLLIKVEKEIKRGERKDKKNS